MYRFSAKSAGNISQCVLPLQRLAYAVIRELDCTAVTGYRGKIRQERRFKAGTSNAHWKESPHNYKPAYALDLVPYLPGIGATWQERQAYYFAGQVKQIIIQLALPIITGADFDNDNNVLDQTFIDPCHFEIEYWKDLI